MNNIDLAWKDYTRKLGTNIARLRTAKGYSQDRVAADAGLSRFTYWKLKRGESNPDTPANPRPPLPIASDMYIRTVHKPSKPVYFKTQTTQSENPQQEPPPPQIRLLEDQNRVSLIAATHRLIRY